MKICKKHQAFEAIG